MNRARIDDQSTNFVVRCNKCLHAPLTVNPVPSFHSSLKKSQPLSYNILPTCIVQRNDQIPIVTCCMCFDSYHITCLDPPLAAKPSYDWYCYKHDLSHLLHKKATSVEINLPKDYLEEVKEKIEIERKENEVLQFLTNAIKQPTEEKFSKEDVRIATEMIVSIATGISAQNNGSNKVDRSTTPTPPKRKRVSSESGAITKLVPLGSAGAKIQKVTPVVTPPTPKKKEIPTKTPIRIQKKPEKDIGKIVGMMDIETLKSIAVQYLSDKSQDGDELIKFSKMAKDVLYKKDSLQQSSVKLKFEEVGGSKLKFDVQLLVTFKKRLHSNLKLAKAGPERMRTLIETYGQNFLLKSFCHF